MATLLEQLGLTSEEVLQSPNIESTANAVTPDNATLNIITGQEEAAGIPQLKEALTTATQRRMAGEQLAQQEQLTIEGRRKKLGVLRGEQAQAAKQAALDIQTLLGGEQLAQTALTSAQQTAAQRANALISDYQTKLNITLQYPGIDIDPLKDDFKTVSEEIGKYTEKQTYIEILRKYGKNTEGSRTTLKKRYKSLLKDLEEEERKAAEKEEARAEEKWQLEKANIQSLIANRGQTSTNVTKDDIGTYIQQGIREGFSWGEIAAGLEDQNVATYKGSTADLLLNDAFGSSSTRSAF